jgi:predicted Zn-dependent protease
MMLPVSARYYDGANAARRNVRVILAEDGTALTILGGPNAQAIHWPLGRLRALPGRAVPTRMILALHKPLRSRDALLLDPARLDIGDPPLIAALRARCPHLMRRDLRTGVARRLVQRGALAVAALAVMLFMILPRMADMLAGLIPVEREVAFGRAVVAQIEAALGAADLGAADIGPLDCAAPEGRAALEAMTARLTDGTDLAYPLEIKVLNHEMVNAFAAPGGQIVIMRGLLEKAGGADAVAAVLAHEIGHVEARDATRNALRAAGSAGLLSMVMGDVTGGAAAVFLGERVMQASYTREAEIKADLFALQLLNGANVSSRGMAEFFAALAEGGSPALPVYLSSHPVSAGRAVHAEANATRQSNTAPVISDAQWAALRRICDARIRQR